MNRQSARLVVFSLAFTFFLIGPALLSAQFGPYPLMKVGDVLDLLTPLVLIPLYWLLYQRERETTVRPMLFLVLAALWVEGQGMHLSANSIGHLSAFFAGTDAETLATFYDEVLSHYLWHLGMIGLAALVLVRHWSPETAQAEPVRWPLVAAAVLHGLVFFLAVAEARTGPIGVPFAVVVSLYGLWRGRERFGTNQTVVFFVTAFLVTSLLSAGWAIYWGAFPEPMSVLPWFK